MQREAGRCDTTRRHSLVFESIPQTTQWLDLK